jgi:putative endonuclease
MNIPHDVGKKGEELARDYLVSKGYQILEQNWRFSKAEIDLIAKDGDILVFVEVKTRSYDFYGSPEDSVGRKKELLVADAGAAYMRRINHEWEIRFDIISVIMPKTGEPTLKHYPDAFFPGLA